jgi:hypothetical protein
MKLKKKRQPQPKRHKRSPELPELSGVLKMSDVLDELVAPFNRNDLTDEELKQLLTYGVLAWNLAIVPKAVARQMFDAIHDPQQSSLVQRTEAWALIEALAERKVILFPDIDRLIIDFTLTRDGDSLHLNVLSTLTPPANSAGP